jgi:Subtilisin inhibitor-like
MMRFALLLVAISALAACGGDDADVVAGPAASPTAETSPKTSLTLAVDLGDGMAAQEWTLTCDPPGGTHPQPELACAALEDVDPDVFAPVGPDQACTQIYGGPETATVRGLWNGMELDASFARNDGCEIARWDAVVELLGAGTGGGAT